MAARPGPYDPDAPTLLIPAAPRVGSASHGSRGRSARDTESGVRADRRRFVRRLAVLVFVITLVPSAWSYYRAVSAPGTDPWTARSVEWLRDNGLNGAVNWVERWWYTHHPPPVGGRPKHGLPRAARPTGATSSPGTSIVPHLAAPQNMAPLVKVPLPGEGVWQPTGRRVAGLPAVYTAFFRPDSVHTSLVAGAMWMDPKLLKAAFVPGLREPGAPQPWGAEIPDRVRPSLVAAFNSGFKIDASRGGVYVDGQMVRPLLDGAASLVI